MLSSGAQPALGEQTTCLAGGAVLRAEYRIRVGREVRVLLDNNLIERSLNRVASDSTRRTSASATSKKILKIQPERCRAVILGINATQHRISLGLKQAHQVGKSVIGRLDEVNQGVELEPARITLEQKNSPLQILGVRSLNQPDIAETVSRCLGGSGVDA